MATRLKKDDAVVVITGKDKGHKGRILRVLPEVDKVIVEGANISKRHQSARRFRETGIIERPSPIHVSNVMLQDPKSEVPTRVRAGTDKDGKKVRIAAKSGAVLDG